MPAFEALISDITVPTKAKVMATLSEAKKNGSERGRPTLRRISTRVAPRARSTSSSSGSRVARPVATLTTMGKNEIRKAVPEGRQFAEDRQDFVDGGLRGKWRSSDRDRQVSSRS
jgi:hypothetical protein